MTLPVVSCPLEFMRVFSWSASNKVNNREYDHPNHIDEMPVKPQHVHAFGMFPFDRARNGERHYNRQCKQANNDVRGVQADERVEGSAKKVRLDCEAFVVDQVIPLPTCPEQEVSSQCNRCQPPEVEFFPVPVPQ